jgi:hypothetical protein
MTRLPSRIVIGTQVWEIVEGDCLKESSLYEGNFGYTLERSNRIVIDKDLPASRKRQTVLHELFHALRYSFNPPALPVKGDMGDWEHYFIGIYEEGLLVVLRDNPELVEYLTQEL